ncbi:MAG: 4Fe-4S dicluster domain-containing protein [Alphaproteobacteria bacterium]
MVSRADFPALIAVLRDEGHRVIGPTVRDGAVVLDDVAGVDVLAAGWGDEQEGGRYRLVRRDDGALFGHGAPAQSWKRFLHPPRVRLWRAEGNRDGFTVTDGAEESPRQAFIGVRACELMAIRIQDKVFHTPTATDPVYAGRRRGAFIVAVACGQAGGTCFCASMGAGPAVGPGHDIAVTELMDGGRHDFLMEAGSDRGAEVLRRLPGRPAAEADLAAAANLVRRTAEAMGRTMEADHAALLRESLRSPHWERVAQRCLGCGNCTMVCPTCFCTTVEDTTDLGGTSAERWRLWDSCFTLEFSYIHGGPVRRQTASRYRQWITHKLSTWHEQFGTSGCVGCGRCITWCPVGIDITEETRALGLERRAEQGGGDGSGGGA